MKNVRFIFNANQNCQFYLHCRRSKLPVFLECHRSKLPAFYCWRLKTQVLSVLLQKKIVSSVFIVPDKNCQLFIVEDKNASFIILWQIKGAIFILIVTDQICQFYPYCHRSKFASFILNVTDQNCLLLIVEDKKCQFYLFWRG